jgi:hypothetical protein
MLGMASSMAIVYVANADLFPVLFSATSMGICNFTARLSTVFALEVAEIKTPLPLIMFSALCLISSVTPFFLEMKKNDEDEVEE